MGATTGSRTTMTFQPHWSIRQRSPPGEPAARGRRGGHRTTTGRTFARRGPARYVPGRDATAAPGFRTRGRLPRPDQPKLECARTVSATMSEARSRRCSGSGCTSRPGAHDRRVNHREVFGDSDCCYAVRMVGLATRSTAAQLGPRCARRNRLRNALREYFLGCVEAVSAGSHGEPWDRCLAPGPREAARLTSPRCAPRCGRQAAASVSASSSAPRVEGSERLRSTQLEVGRRMQLTRRWFGSPSPCGRAGRQRHFYRRTEEERASGCGWSAPL